jgi:two-component system, chemotaxis family, chemotaxis protein CheY
MKRVLIVDDSLAIRMILKGILTDSGYDVVAEAVNGVQAVDMYKEFKPDLVTLDIVMPEMDGITALEKIMELDSEAKVVMVTSIEQRDKLKKAITSGASDYIVKPFEKDRVLTALVRAINRTTS